MRESIFYAAFRSFILSLFAVMGFAIGLLGLIALIGSFTGTPESDPAIDYKYSASIQPNASGIRKALSSTSPVILKVNLHGIIGLDTLNQHTIKQMLIESRERAFADNRVKALLLHIDSPGGTVVDADGIYHAIKAYKENYKVPVYAYVDGLCASGGVYIAVAADQIYASDASLIGSVGVITPPFLNFSQLIEKIGVQSLTLSEGKGKDNLNPLRPWKKGEEENLKEAIAFYYNSFVDVVSSNRPNLSKTKLVDEYGANIYPAPIAKEYGYIDHSGVSLNDTIQALAKQIGIDDDYYQVVELESKSWVSDLFRSEMGLFKGRLTHQIVLTPDMDPKLFNQYLYLYRP